jgi:Domain of unknown function (DUF1931)
MGDLEIDAKCSRTGLTVFARACLEGNFEIADLLLVVGNANPNVLVRDSISLVELVISKELQDSMIYLASEHVNIEKKELIEQCLALNEVASLREEFFDD